MTISLFRWLPLAACLCATPLHAQSEPVMQLGIPGDTVMATPSAFMAVAARGELLVVIADAGFVPVIADYTANAPAQAIEVSICGVRLNPFTVPAPIQNGYIEIPTGSADFATAAAPVLQGEVSCDAVTLPEVALTPPPAANPLPPRDPGLHIAVAGEEMYVWPPGIARTQLLANEESAILSLALELGPEATSWLAETTTRNVGGEIQISSCGEILIAASVPYPFTEGFLSFPIGADRDRAVDIADNIASAISCD